MYIETVKNLMCDEVAETLAAITAEQVIEYHGYAYGIPRKIIRSGSRAVMEWRYNILHGITGNMDVISMESGYNCGSIPVWTLHNMLAHKTFTIRTASATEGGGTIYNLRDLAEYLDTDADPQAIAENVRKYHDYETRITFSDDGIKLTVTAGETGKQLSRKLYYPFSADVYDDAHVGLQCWADATYWDAVHAGEV